VTAVGGTSLGVSSSDGYLFETGWGTTSSTLTNGAWDPAPPGDHIYGSGGGTSLFYAEPDYQKPVVPKKLAKANGGKPARVVPDVSLVGDPNTGMLIGQTQTFPDGTTKYSEYRLGGTSLSSPLMAGVMALADQQAGRLSAVAAAPVLERIVNLQCVIPHKTIRAIGADMATTEKSFHILRRRAADGHPKPFPLVTSCSEAVWA